MSETSTTVGTVQAIALKPGRGETMIETDQAVAERDGTLAGSAACNPRRGVTFLSSRQWSAVMRELGADKPWHTRRANVLIDADSLGDLRGKRIQIGGATFDIFAETRPCELMDSFHAGLLNALKPDCRAGVYGRVVSGGPIRIGDSVRVVGVAEDR